MNNIDTASDIADVVDTMIPDDEEVNEIKKNLMKLKKTN